MTYDKNGLGFSELAFLSLSYPEIFETIETAINDDNEAIGLSIARKAITLANLQDL